MSKIKRFFGIEDEEKKPQQPKEWNPPSWQSYKERVEEEKRRRQPVQINDGLNKNGNLSQEPIPAQDSFGEKEKFEFELQKKEDVKLTVVLIENSAMVAKQKEDLKKIVESLVNTGFVSLINYGGSIRIMEKVEAAIFECSEILNEEDIGEEACFYDALVALEDVVNHNYNMIEHHGFKRYRIAKVEVIGIGRAIDNFSAYSMEKGIEAFKKVASHTNVTTKYFCLSEKDFIHAATIGFRSIGAIRRTFS